MGQSLGATRENLGLGWWEPTPPSPSCTVTPAQPLTGLCTPPPTRTFQGPASLLALAFPLDTPTLGPRCWGRLAEFPMGP